MIITVSSTEGLGGPTLVHTTVTSRKFGHYKLFSGSNRTVIVDTNLEAPMGLALDLKRHRLFWCDSALTTLNSVNFDGADRHSLMESESRKWLSKPMGVTFFEGHLYWIDVTFNGGSISKVSTIQTDRAPELLADHLTDIYDLKIYSSRAQKGKLYTSLSFNGKFNIHFLEK
jgi:hypothetical protein